MDFPTRVRHWLESLHCGPGYRQPHETAASLSATCSAVLVLEGLGETPPDAEACCRFLQGCQDAASGLFGQPSDSGPLASHDLPPSQTGFASLLAINALDALGSRALHPLHFLEEFGARRTVVRRLQELRDCRTSSASQYLAVTLALLVSQLETEGNTEAGECYHLILDWLDQEQDASTGLWKIDGDDNPRKESLATAHFVALYEYVGRPLRHVSQITECMLAFQQTHGSGAGDWSSSAFEELLRIDALATLSRYTDDPFGDLSRTLQDCAAKILTIPESDSSFLESQDLSPSKRADSVTPNAPLGAIGTTWMRLLSVATVAHRFPETLPGNEWHFRRWPLLGFQPAGFELSHHQRQVLPVWIRTRLNLLEGADFVTDEAPALSVIVPCYNLGRYLQEAIASVSDDETRPKLELIVVDDGSTDEFTQIVLDEFQRRGVRVLRESNQGVAAARNRGIRQTQGRYVCCLDPDDHLRPGYLAKAIGILDSQPEVGIVSGDTQLFDEDDQTICHGACDSLADMLVVNRGIEPAVFRRDAWEAAGGYCETFSTPGIEDWDLWIGILEQGYRIAYLPEVVWEYRIRAGQMSDAMYQPDLWGTLMRELMDRHRDSFQRNAAELFARQSVMWAESRAWINDRNRTIAWWQRQAGNWQRMAEELQELLPKNT